MTEVTAYYWDQDDKIGVTVMKQSQAEKDRTIRFTARDLVTHKVQLQSRCLINEMFAVRKRVENIVEAETELVGFYKTVGELELRQNQPETKEALIYINKVINELNELKSKLEHLGS